MEHNEFKDRLYEILDEVIRYAIEDMNTLCRCFTIKQQGTKCLGTCKLKIG